MALGATHYNWRRDVQRVVDQLEASYPRVRCNTYKDHPFPGWDDRSVDVWGAGGRGDAIPLELGREIVRVLVRNDSGPLIRHWIYLHRWWLRGVGFDRWPANDHSGRLRHVHVTYI